MSKKFVLGRCKSFRDAGRGILLLGQGQINMRVHVLAIAIVVVAGYFVGLARWEWMLVIFAIATVVICEAINTAIEMACDAITEEHHPRIRDAKDIAAGAVLLSAIAALIIGLGIFIPKFL